MLLFELAIASGQSICYDPRRLGYIRRHFDSVTHKRSYSHKFALGYLTIYKALQEKTHEGSRVIIKAELARLKTKLYLAKIINEKPNWLDFFYFTIFLILSLDDSYKAFKTWFYTLMCCVSSSIAFRIYYIRNPRFDF